MLSLSFRQTAMLILIFVVACGGFILLDQQNRLDAAKGPAGNLIDPFVRLFNRAAERVGSIGADSSGEANDELVEVKAERDKLLAENARLKQLEREVEQLRSQLEFRQVHPELQVITASVLSRDPNSTHQILVIDRGSNDGIQKGMAVISPNFYVGQITQVDPDRSQVTLSIDASAQIGGMLQRNGADGVVHGEWQSGGQMSLRHLAPQTEVSEGDLVVTSSRTTMIPEGLVIGQVYDIDRDIQADTLTLGVSPLVDAASLTAVSVILGTDSPTP